LYTKKLQHFGRGGVEMLDIPRGRTLVFPHGPNSPRPCNVTA